MHLFHKGKDSSKGESAASELQVSCLFPAHLLLHNSYNFEQYNKACPLKFSPFQFNFKSAKFNFNVAYSISSVEETRDRAPSISREMEFMRWFPAAFLANGVLKVTYGGIELTTPVL